MLHARPTPATAALAVAATGAGVAFATWPFAGRSAEQWLPTVSRYGVVVAGGRHRHRAPAPVSVTGRRPGARSRSKRGRRTRHGGPFAGLALLGVEVPDGPPVGVVHDRRARTLTASLHVRGPHLRPPRARGPAAPGGGLVFGPRRARPRALRPPPPPVGGVGPARRRSGRTARTSTGAPRSAPTTPPPSPTADCSRPLRRVPPATRCSSASRRRPDRSGPGPGATARGGV